MWNCDTKTTVDMCVVNTKVLANNFEWAKRNAHERTLSRSTIKTILMARAAYIRESKRMIWDQNKKNETKKEKKKKHTESRVIL